MGKEPARATQRDARQWAATLAACYRPASTAAKLSACASFHSWLVEQGLARANPFDGAQRPTVPHYANSAVLTAAEVRRLNSYLDAPPLRVLDPADLPPSRLRDRALVGFLLATGRWPSEIAGLRWSNLLNDGDLWTLEDHQVIPARSVRNIVQGRKFVLYTMTAPVLITAYTAQVIMGNHSGPHNIRPRFVIAGIGKCLGSLFNYS